MIPSTITNDPLSVNVNTERYTGRLERHADPVEIEIKDDV